MMWAEIRNNWPALQEQVESRWNRLSIDEIASVAGRRPKLIALLQTRYELDREAAIDEADGFVRSLQVLTR